MRLLAVIGHYDPAGAAGFGCTLTQRELAAVAGMNEGDIRRLIKSLSGLGYISVEPRSDAARRVTLRVRR